MVAKQSIFEEYPAADKETHLEKKRAFWLIGSEVQCLLGNLGMFGQMCLFLYLDSGIEIHCMARRYGN